MTDSRVGNPHPIDLEHDRVVLSDREAEVVKKTRNQSYAKVADDLGIAESTVGTYCSRANRKLSEQVPVIETMLDQQCDANREENIEAVARLAVNRLRDQGLNVEFGVQQNESEDPELGNSVDEVKATQESRTTTEPVDVIQGELGDDSDYTKRIREYANDVIHGDKWALSDVDLSKVTFETRKKARKRHGVASYNGNNRVTVGISEHTIENAGFDAVKETIRHELVHVWQYQHKGETVELPNGVIVDDVETGHTGCWYEWEKLMDVQRTNSYYSLDPAEYNYRIWCSSCHKFVNGKFRMCSTVRCHSESHSGLGWCSDCDEKETDGSTFVVTNNNDEFYDNKDEHEDW